MIMHQGKQEDVLKEYGDNTFHSCVTDPPYGLKFMGKKWDYSVPSVKEWESVYRVLRPGAFLLAFGGTRTYHRMVCNVEDAGFEIRDMLGWLYGSGFPKSHNITEELGTALKPAIEPIVLARKPLDGTVQENYDRWGTGVLNIAACRIPGEPWKFGSQTNIKGGNYGHRSTDMFTRGAAHAVNVTGGENGRWPANIQHDGSEEVVSLFPYQKSGAMKKSYEYTNTGNSLGAPSGSTKQIHESSEGSAARFFYCGKASRADRNEGKVVNSHPTVKPTNLMRYYLRLVNPIGGEFLDPYMGSGSTLKAGAYEFMDGVGIDQSPEEVDIAEKRVEYAIMNRNRQIDIF